MKTLVEYGRYEIGHRCTNCDWTFGTVIWTNSYACCPNCGCKSVEKAVGRWRLEQTEYWFFVGEQRKVKFEIKEDGNC